MKLFIDSFVTRLAVEKNGVSGVKKELQKLMNSGHTLVCTEASSMDNLVFRSNVEWFKKNLHDGRIIIEVYQGDVGDTASGIKAMVNKKFEWSSYSGKATEWTGDFEKLARKMPDYQNLLKVYRAVLKYALPNGSWTRGSWHTPHFFTDEQLEELGLEKNQTGNRSIVYSAMQEHGYSMETYIDYTREYLAGLVSQHNCDDIAMLDMI